MKHKFGFVYGLVFRKDTYGIEKRSDGGQD